MSVYQIVTDEILKIMEQGVVPWKQPWSSKGVARNYVSHRPYHGTNMMLLSYLNYEDPQFLTYKQAESLGAQVRKGEHGYIVIFWSFVPSKEDKTKTIPILRYYKVFNVSQVEGLKQRREAPEHTNTPVPSASSIIDNMPHAPVIVVKGDRACYYPQLDVVNVPKMEDFQSSEHYYATTFHELTHSTGHKSRLNRFGEEVHDHLFGSESYSKEELVAELGASFLCAEARIDAHTKESSAAYLKTWMARLKDDATLFVSAAGKASKAADYIMGRTNEVQAEG